MVATGKQLTINNALFELVVGWWVSNHSKVILISDIETKIQKPERDSLKNFIGQHEAGSDRFWNKTENSKWTKTSWFRNRADADKKARHLNPLFSFAVQTPISFPDTNLVCISNVLNARGYCRLNTRGPRRLNTRRHCWLVVVTHCDAARSLDSDCNRCLAQLWIKSLPWAFREVTAYKTNSMMIKLVTGNPVWKQWK